MIFGGIQKQSLIDYPGKISTVLFTSGCNFRCKFCHNAGLVLPEEIKKNGFVEESEILKYIKKNENLLDAVTITGGEPTIHSDLKEFIKKIKPSGLSIKLDTNGTNPIILKELIDEKLIDYVAMDIKAPLLLKKYQELAGKNINKNMMENINRSIELILCSGIDHDFRTTILKEHHSKKDIKTICNGIKGAKRYSLQKFNPTFVLDENFKKKESYSFKELNNIAEELKEIIPEINCR